MNSGTEPLLRDTLYEELDAIASMERSEGSKTILPASAEQHREDFSRPNLLYKSVVVHGELLGFLILALDADGLSLELRRIVISRPGLGYGTRAVREVDQITRERNRERIWLDVFEDNLGARHVYENCGYSVFGDTELNGRRLLLYEKLLAST